MIHLFGLSMLDPLWAFNLQPEFFHTFFYCLSYKFHPLVPKSVSFKFSEKDLFQLNLLTDYFNLMANLLT